MVRLTSPGTVVSHQLVQRAGVVVKGKVVCSDGKPPVGWRINALPEWWNFGSSPSGTQIAPDGSFTLLHIVPEKYNVTVSVPMGGTTFTNKSLLKSTDLTKSKRPLSLKLDYPSPASLVSISGRIRFTGGKAQIGFWINADSDDKQHHVGVYLRPGETEFRIALIPPGKYTLDRSNSGVRTADAPMTVMRRILASPRRRAASACPDSN